MSDGRERTDAEREAARRERELRRTAGSGLPPSSNPSEDDGSGIRFLRPRRPDAADSRPEPPPEPPRSASSSDGAELPPIRLTRAQLAERSPRRQGQRVGSARGAQRPPGRGGRTVIVRRVAAVGVLVAALALVWFLVELFQPFHGSGHGSVVVRIPHDASSGEVGHLLARDGIVSSAFFFELRATIDGDRGKLFAGTYRLPLGASYSEALAILTTPPPAPKVTGVNIIPGLSRQRLGALLRSEHVRGSYVAATRGSRLLDPATYGAPRDTPSLEGFLFPDRYQVREPLRISELVDAQLETFKKRFAAVDMTYARSKHLTPYDVLIIASIAQAEAATTRDFRLVASVIYNRLAHGMALGSDATTAYAVGNYTRPLTNAQLHSPSPWNTRVHTGLPPTPINSPSLAAIEAAAHPPATGYLYFIVKVCGNGALEYASNYPQFLVEDQAYQAASAARGGNSPEFCSAKHRG